MVVFFLISFKIHKGTIKNINNTVTTKYCQVQLNIYDTLWKVHSKITTERGIRANSPFLHEFGM